MVDEVLLHYRKELEFMKLKYLIPTFMVGLSLFIMSCGEVANPTGRPKTISKEIENGGDYVFSFVVEADGKNYRCFQSTDYRGGLWCTEKVID